MRDLYKITAFHLQKGQGNESQGEMKEPVGMEDTHTAHWLERNKS